MRVIAKAYRDRPLDRVTVGHKGKVIFIADPSIADSVRNTIGEGIGFPSKCLFEFDSALFNSLREAWDNGDVEKLGVLWREAAPLSTEALEAA